MFYGIALHQPVAAFQMQFLALSASRREQPALRAFSNVGFVPENSVISRSASRFRQPRRQICPIRDEASKQNRLAIPKNSEINKRFGR